MTKERILSHIRQLAAANDGRPPGSAVFERETGLTERSWRGKYWVRWSDALQEAGLAPNTFNEAYTDDAILDHLAKVVLEAGHWPTNAELQLKRRGEPSFPSHNVFSRLGRKPQLAQRLSEYCRRRTAYSPVSVIADAVVQAGQHTKPGPSEDASPVAGYVYLIKYGRHYKLGRTNSTERRQREIQLELPNDTRLVHSIPTDDPSGIEAYWHRRFETKRHKGEWFSLTPEDLAAFRRRKYQ